MNPNTLELLKYPIGRFSAPKTYSTQSRKDCIQKLRILPGLLRQVTYNLTDTQLDLPYRAEGWTSRKIVHHLADSHINSFTRFKLALTEDNPMIKPYDEAAWEECSDADLAIEVSLSILDGIHIKLVHLLEHMSEADFQKTLAHPDWKNDLSLDKMTALYAWHGHHHMNQIVQLKKRQGW